MQYKAKNRTKLYRQNNNPYRLHFDLQEFNQKSVNNEPFIDLESRYICNDFVYSSNLLAGYLFLDFLHLRFCGIDHPFDCS